MSEKQHETKKPVRTTPRKAYGEPTYRSGFTPADGHLYWRELFEEYFVQKAEWEHVRPDGSKQRGCEAISSDSLVPAHDPSLLFTGAGMNQFKDDFTGVLRHGTRAATTCQKCVRMPDLENVGKTARHHTFFEMLGYFSFGGFFKEEAIRWIWEFYTGPEWCAIDPARMRVSIYRGEDGKEDSEARAIWEAVFAKDPRTKDHAKKGWIYPLGEKDNFWPASCPSKGPNGVCGPCSEIFYDLEPDQSAFDDHWEPELWLPNTTDEQNTPENNGNRFMELGNCVFTQFERSGPTPGKGILTPLPDKNIDFGGGLERLVMVKEDVGRTLDTGLFQAIRDLIRPQLAELSDSYGRFAFTKKETAQQIERYGIRTRDLDGEALWSAVHQISNGKSDPTQSGAVHAAFGEAIASCADAAESARLTTTIRFIETCAPDTEWRVRERRIADHIRASVFMIADGVTPSNEKQGYVLRRILRRAYRDGSKLGFDGPFLHKLVAPVRETYEKAYPEIGTHARQIHEIILREEEDFSRVLANGLARLDKEIETLANTGDKKLPGDVAFDLHSTYGLPIDVTRDVLQERGYDVDEDEFEDAFKKFRNLSRKTAKFSNELFDKSWFGQLKRLTPETKFTGYDSCSGTATVKAIVVNGELVGEAAAGAEAVLVLDQSPFYGESGGQVGDSGKLVGGKDAAATFTVADTQKKEGYHLHEGQLSSGTIRVGDKVTATVDADRRALIRANHSATHLMHAALREVLGDHVHQKGSLVNDQHLRFDFSHTTKVSAEEIARIESLVNGWIRHNDAVDTRLTTPDGAREAGALMFFGEKYGAEVRMLTMGEHSKELCGGTHVGRTGDIGQFRITAESSVASGVRRIEAVTGAAALLKTQHEHHLLHDLSQSLRVAPDQIAARVEAMLAEIKELKQAKAKAPVAVVAQAGGPEPETLSGSRAVIHHLTGASMNDLLTMKDALMQDAGLAAVLLAGDGEGKASMVLALSQPMVNKGLNAGPLLGEVIAVVDGRGGGKKHLAQAGGKNPAKIADALALGRQRLGEAFAAANS